MSDGTKTKRVEFVIAAKDEASRVVKQATANIKKELAAASNSRGSIPLAGAPSERVQLAFPKPNRSAQEQQIRDMMAGRIRAMRESADRSRLYDEMNRRLYGDPQKEAPKPEPFNPSAAEGMAAFGRSDASERTRRLARERDKTWYQNIKSQMDGFEKMGKLVRGAGALAAVSELGRALQKLPEIQNQYYDHLRQGMTKTEAFSAAIGEAVPVVGELAKGFRALWDFLGTSEFEAKKLRAKEDRQDNRDTREAQNERNQRRRGALLSETVTAQRDATRRRALAMASGADKDKLAAEFTYQDQIAEANRLNAKAGTLTKTEEQDKVRQAARQQRLAAELEYRQKLKEIDDKYAEQANTAEGEFRRQSEQMDQETIDRGLERQGRGVEARARQRKREFDQIESELRDQLSMALKGIDPNDPRSSMVMNSFKRAMQSVAAQRAEANAAAAQEEARKRQDAAQVNQQNLRQQDLSLAARAAQMGGRGRLADQINNRSTLESDLNAINSAARDRLRENAGDAAQIEAERMAQERRARARYGMSELESALDRGKQYASSSPAAIRGELGGLMGVVGSQGAVDPTLAEAKKTADAVAKSLKIQTDQVKATEKLQDLMADLIRNLKAVPT